jgi:hypothetical protein
LDVGDPFDDGSGEIKIWKIEEFDKVKYPKDMYGRFFSSDCFIILYKFMRKNKFFYIIYYWQGSQASKVNGNFFFIFRMKKVQVHF